MRTPQKSYRLSAETVRRIAEIAKAEHRSNTKVIEVAVADYHKRTIEVRRGEQ